MHVVGLTLIHAHNDIIYINKYIYNIIIMHVSFNTDAALYVTQYLTSLAKISAKGKCREINP